MIQNRFGGRLTETMPSRAIDLRPRLAHAIDALDALGEARRASLFEAIRRRVDQWALQSFYARLLLLAAGGVSAALVAALSSTSKAQEINREPGRHPVYPVEMEPHALVAWDNLYGGTGLGPGLRLSIPVLRDGFIKSIDDSVAVGFGIDWLHYSGCYFNGACSADYVMFPVAMQWNFFFTRRWSAFGEPGLFLYKGFIEGCGSRGCEGGEPTSLGVRPAIAVGGRYHFNDYITLTVRLGYPTISAGVSCF